MNKKAKKLVLTLGILVLTTSCKTASNFADNIQKPTEATKVTNSTTDTLIKVDGSSTVYPITQAVVKAYQADHKNNNQVKVSISGTSGGFEKFCQGQIDINNASRPINQSEMADCKKNGISYMELPIAFDALTIAVNLQNTWANDITIAELKKYGNPVLKEKLQNGIKYALLGQTVQSNYTALVISLGLLTILPKQLLVKPDPVAKIT